MERKKLMKF